MAEIRQGSAPNFCPPVQEGSVFTFEDDAGDLISLEFLGLILSNERRYGFFYPITEANPVGSSGEIVLLEVTEIDDDGQPLYFELVEDEAIAKQAYLDFAEATKDLYDFE